MRILRWGITALANGRATIVQRLARWLLMCHDRIGNPQLRLTHEFLSLMLGTRRSGVTTALHILEGEGLIRSDRGSCTIKDRAGLEARARGIYGVPEAEYRRLIGNGHGESGGEHAAGLAKDAQGSSLPACDSAPLVDGPLRPQRA